MLFRSTNSRDPQLSFKDVVFRCLPDDGGLYIPSRVRDLREFFLHAEEGTNYPACVAEVTSALLQGELNLFSAARVAESAATFQPEIVPLDETHSLLTLYNGPTGTFKDFGIAFLAAMLEELLKNNGTALVLSTAQGDNGVSLEQSFHGRRGLVSVLLYPEGVITGLDTSQFATNGGNIIPIQVRGTLDDCRRLVKETLNDEPFSERYKVTSANGINIGRLLPQAFYYLYAFVKLKQKLSGNLYFSVPSGNFGNLVSGLYAWKFGLPVNGFIAAMNSNNALGDFFRGGEFKPRLARATKSPALDVSVPANYARLRSFYDEDPALMQDMVFPASIDDDATLGAMELAWKRYGAILDPHGALAFAAALDFAAASEHKKPHIVTLVTGHPAQEAALVKKAIGQEIRLPAKLELLTKKVSPIAKIDPNISALESVIASCI